MSDLVRPDGSASPYRFDDADFAIPGSVARDPLTEAWGPGPHGFGARSSGLVPKERPFMCHVLHKWECTDACISHLWCYQQCSRCGGRRIFQRHHYGYAPVDYSWLKTGKFREYDVPTTASPISVT